MISEVCVTLKRGRFAQNENNYIRLLSGQWRVITPAKCSQMPVIRKHTVKVALEDASISTEEFVGSACISSAFVFALSRGK